MDINYQEIGRRIARRRHELGLKQTEVCELCSLNEKYLSNIERAKSIPFRDSKHLRRTLAERHY